MIWIKQHERQHWRKDIWGERQRRQEGTAVNRQGPRGEGRLRVVGCESVTLRDHPDHREKK